jgi:hypothetical protein
VTSSCNARDEEPPAISEAVAQVIRMYGYDAVRDELAKQAIARTENGAIVLHRAPGLSDEEWADFCAYSRVWMKLEVAKLLGQA